MDNICTYILCVKVWSEKLGFCIKNRNIENIIKEKIIKNNETFDIIFDNKIITVLLKWKLIKWKKPYDEMMTGDLIINSIYRSDSIINKFTDKLLIKIEKELKDKNLLDKENKIIFTILNTISERIPLDETVENSLNPLHNVETMCL
jgi:hypothetical protein